jgi:hypothetical protein
VGHPDAAKAIVIRCLTCHAIECAKVIVQDVWPDSMERLPVEQVRQERWCRCGERQA